MDKHNQELFATLTGRHNIILTTLLSSESMESWEKIKYIIVSHTPFLTLEMAVNRVCRRENSSPPLPAQIYSALEYAKEKNKQFRKVTHTKTVTN